MLVIDQFSKSPEKERKSMADKGKGKMIEDDYDECRDNKILEFQKMGSSSLQRVHYVQREMERLDLNRPPVDAGSCMAEEERFIPKKKRTPRYDISFQCLQGSCSTSVVNHQKVEEFRIVHGRRELIQDRRNYYQLNESVSKVRQQRARVIQWAPAPQRIPGYMEESIREKNGTYIMWVTEKDINAGDTSKNQNRLFLPRDCYASIESFMTDKEWIEFFKLPGHRLHVNLIDQNLGVWDMELRYWPSLGCILLTGNCDKTENSDETGTWNKFVKHFVLVPGIDKVQIWCFRVPALGMGLCFAINILKPPAPEGIPSPIAAPGPSTSTMN